jgi:hypothetical protein
MLAMIQRSSQVGNVRELHMSPANVYRFFAAKCEINEAVCMDGLGSRNEGGRLEGQRVRYVRRGF